MDLKRLIAETDSMGDLEKGWWIAELRTMTEEQKDRLRYNLETYADACRKIGHIMSDEEKIAGRMETIKALTE